MNKDIKVILDALRPNISQMSKDLLLDELERLIRDNTELNLKYVKQPIEKVSQDLAYYISQMEQTIERLESDVWDYRHEIGRVRADSKEKISAANRRNNNMFL